MPQHRGDCRSLHPTRQSPHAAVQRAIKQLMAAGTACCTDQTYPVWIGFMTTWEAGGRPWSTWSSVFYLLFPLREMALPKRRGCLPSLLLCFYVIRVHPCSEKFMGLYSLSGREVQIVSIFPDGGTMRQSSVWPAHITLLTFGTAEYFEWRFLECQASAL